MSALMTSTFFCLKNNCIPKAKQFKNLLIFIIFFKQIYRMLTAGNDAFYVSCKNRTLNNAVKIIK
jgi:hypothetical protein